MDLDLAIDQRITIKNSKSCNHFLLNKHDYDFSKNIKNNFIWDKVKDYMVVYYREKEKLKWYTFFKVHFCIGA